MGWGDTKGNLGDLYMGKLDANKKYRIRCLLGIFGGPTEPISFMVHQVPAVIEGNKTIRTFSTQGHAFMGFDKDGLCRSGLCGQKDPLWAMLNDDDKYYRDREKNITGEKHFPLIVQHGMFVWSYEHNAVKFLKQGNQLFKAIRTILEGTDLERDLLIWKEQTSGNKAFSTEYKAVGVDKSPFNPGIEIIPTMLDWEGVIRRELPPPFDNLLPYIKGQTEGGKPLPSRSTAMVKYLGSNMFQITSGLPQSGPSPEGQQEQPVASPSTQTAVPAQAISPQATIPAEPEEPEPGYEPEPGPEAEAAPINEGELTIETALAMVCTKGKTYNGKTLKDIVDVQPNYLTWLGKNLKEPEDERLRLSAVMVKDALDKGEIKRDLTKPVVSKKEAVTKTAAAVVAPPTETVDMVQVCDNLLREKIGVDNDQAMINILKKHSSGKVSVLDQFLLNRWPQECLQSLYDELSAA